MQFRAAILSLTALASTTALADETPPPPQDVWTGKGQAGYLASQGNSEAKSANVALDMAYYTDPWKHAFHFGALYGESAHVVAAERWDALWQSNYDFTTDLFAFGALRFQHDMFNGFQHQASETAGIGYKILNSADTKLSAQVGVGYRELRPETIDQTATFTYRTLLPSENGAVGTAGLDYSQVLTSTVTLTDKLLGEFGSADSLITNALALTVKMSTKLALSVGYNIQDNTKPPAGLKKIDQVETVNLVYSF